MKIKSTDSTRKLQQVAASMAIENMHLDESLLKELEKVNNGEKTYEDLIKEVATTNA